MELSDFNEGGLSLQDFDDRVSAGVNLSRNSLSSTLSSAALLSGQTPQEYRQSLANAMKSESRGESLNLIRDLQRRVADDSMYAAGSVLADDAIDFGMKEFVRDRIGNQDWPDMQAAGRVIDTLAEEAGIATSTATESERAAEARGTILESIRAVNDQKVRLQNAINGLKAEYETDASGKAARAAQSNIADLGELFVPFAEWIHFERLQKDLLGDDAQDLALMGQQKQNVIDWFEQLPLDEKDRILETVVDTFRDNDLVVLPDGNEMLTIDFLEQTLGTRDYSNTERVWDNVSSLLEVVGIGGLVRAAGRGGKVASKAPRINPQAADAGRNLRKSLEATAEADEVEAVRTVVRSDVNPTSPSQIVKDVNPEQARQIHRAVEADETGEIAEAAYGTNRTDALAKDRLPEPEFEEGTIPHKVEIDGGPQFSRTDDVRDATNARGALEISDEGREALRARLKRGFEDITGLRLQENSLAVRWGQNGLPIVRGIYTPVDSGFSSVAHALENVEYYFRDYGVKSSDVTVLRRDGDKWVKASDAAEEGGEYAVSLDYTYHWDTPDLDFVEEMVTGNSLLVRALQFADQGLRDFPARLGQGSVVQNLLDPHSVLKKQFVDAASVATDKSYSLKAMYVDMFEDFTKKYNKLDKKRKAFMTDYINRANRDGIRFDEGDLARRGFTQDEIQALKVWRRSNDMMWYAANEDLARTLIRRGYVALVDHASDTRLIGKPIKRGSASRNTKFYDPTNHTVQRLSKKGLDDLYESGGELIELDEVLQVGNREVTHVISYNRANKSYSRRIRTDEKVLNYRDGYYPVMYDANFFLKQTYMVDGVKRQRTIASARNKKETKKLLEDIKKRDNLTDEQLRSRYQWVPDRRATSERSILDDDNAWHLAQNSGASYQRVRGRPLQDVSGELHMREFGNLVDPLEAVAKQIGSISNRVAFRPYLDNMKDNWIKYYGKDLGLEPDPRTGRVEFPANVNDIKGRDTTRFGTLADAKTYFNYIRGLEKGYINGIDEVYKGLMSAAANELGGIVGGKIERGLFKMAEASPTHAAKTATFKLFLASNPARQAIIQRSQILLMPVVNPKYVSSGAWTTDLVDIRRAAIGVDTSKRGKRLYMEAKKTGVLEAVDSNNLIRTDALHLAEQSNLAKVARAAGTPLRAAQRVGFDWAEQDVLLVSWLAHRDKARRAGKNLRSQRVQEEILADARAFTLNMNRSGDMPYSQNTFSIATQFFQFQHKALVQSLTNKSLSARQRAALLAYSTVLFGVDASLLTIVASEFLEDYTGPSELLDELHNGLIDYATNKMLTVVSGEEQNIDFGDISPSSAYGTGNLVSGMLDTNIASVLSNSPAASLVSGGNPRVMDFLKTSARYMFPPANYDDPTLQVQFSDVLRAGAQMFSGYSAAFRAHYAFETGKAMSSSGRITDDDVTKIEATFMTLGFGTHYQEGTQKVYDKLWSANDPGAKEDFENWYKEARRLAARRGISVEEQEMQMAILSEAWRVFGQDRPGAVQLLRQQMERDTKSGEENLFDLISRQIGIKTQDEVWELVNAMPAGRARDGMIKLLEDIDSYQGLEEEE